MKKRILSFLLAVILAFTPAVQASATGLDTVQTVETETVEEVSEEEATGETVAESEEESGEELSSAAENETSEEEPEEAESSQEASSEEVTPEEATSEEVTSEEVTEDVLETIQETGTTEEELQTLIESVSGNEAMGAATVVMLTEDINLSEAAEDASGTGWSWKADSKTFTMNGYHSTGKLSLPEDAVIVLAKGSTNSMDTRESSKYAIYAYGDLTITGAGKLTITNKDDTALYAEGTLNIEETTVHFINEEGAGRPFRLQKDSVKFFASEVKIVSRSNGIIYLSHLSGKASTLTVGSLRDGIYYGANTSLEGVFELLFEKNPVYITKNPERISEIHVGESVSLQATGKSPLGKTVKYQWYTTSDFQNPGNGASKISKATTSKLTVKGTARGIKYYFCEVTCDGNSVLSEVAAVATGNAGMKICTENISLSSAVDKLDTDGWKWDPNTNTVTFSNIDLLIPFPSNYTNVQVRSGYTVVLEGNNYFNDNDGRITITNAGQVGKITTFTGPGTMWVDKINTGYLEDDAEVYYTGGLTMHIAEFDSEKGKIVLDNATVKSQKESLMKYDDLTLRNGAYLEVVAPLRVWADITVGDNCTLIVGEWIECSDSLTIGNDAKVIIGKYLDMDTTVGSGVDVERTLTINGLLQIKESNTQPVYFYSEAENPLVLGEGVNILYPEGATWDNKIKSSSSYYYGFKHNDSYELDGIIVGKSLSESKKIKGSTKIAGTAKYNCVLTAPEVTPLAALVGYQWQYAPSVNGPWEDIYNERSKTYRVSTKYDGYYLRVITKGMGEYTGQIESAPIGPVTGNPGALKGIWYDTDTVKEARVGTFPFDGDYTDYGEESDMTKDGKVSYSVVPVNKNANITIRNTTTGFEAVGTDADIPVVKGTNNIEIQVDYGVGSVVYMVRHKIVDKKYTLYLKSSTESTGISVTATWEDESGQKQSLTADDWNPNVQKDILAGTEVTITSVGKPGTYPLEYIGLDEVPDKTKEGFPVTFVMDSSKTVKRFSSRFVAFAPEDLSAKWQPAKGSVQISVKAYPIPGTSPVEYMSTSIYVSGAGGSGSDTQMFSVGGTGKPNADGYYRRTIYNLTDDIQHTITAKYKDDVINEEQPEELQTAVYVLEKRDAVTLVPKTEYVVLKPDESVDIPVTYETHTESKLVVEPGYDTEVVSASKTKIVTDASGNRTLHVEAVGEGTTYLTLRGEDYETEEGMQYVYAFVRVDVSKEDEASTLNLGVKSGTLNLYEDSSLTVPVYQMECGHDIESAEFANEALNDRFTIEVVNDRTLKVIPIVPEDDGVVDYANWLKQKGTTGKFTSKIRINYNGAASRESEENLQITLTAKQPKVTVSSLTFNNFYTKEQKNLKITATGKEISKVQVDTAKNAGKTVACPSWLTVNEEERSVDFDGKSVTAKKISSNLYLKVWLKGYRIPVQAKVKAQVSYKAPKLKLKNTTVSVMEDKKQMPSVYLQVVSGDKKISYESIDVDSLRLMSNKEYSKLSTKDRKTYLPPYMFSTNYKFDKVTGEVTLTWMEEPLNGKFVMYVGIKDGKEPIKLTFTVKVRTIPAITLNKKSVTTDAVFGSYPLDDAQYVKVNCNVTKYLDAKLFDYKVTMVGDKTNTDYSSHFSMWWDDEKGAIRIQRYSSAVAGKTYKVTVSVQGIDKTASFNIKVKKSAAPVFKASVTKFTLNGLKNDSTYNKPIKLSIPKKYGKGYYVSQIEVLTPDNLPDEGTLSVGRGYEQNSNIPHVYFMTTPSTMEGTYTVKIHGGMYGGTTIRPAVIKVKVENKLPKISIPTVSLNKDLANYDKATITLPVDEKYIYASDNPWVLEMVTDAKGKDASDKLNCELQMNEETGDAVLFVKCNEHTGYNTSYKLKLACVFTNDKQKKVTVTVKTAKKAVAITVKGKATGSIDIARPYDSSADIVYIFTNWNKGYYADGQEPVLEWEVYAKNGKNAVTMANGALNDSGLVAKGSSLSDSPQEGSWFDNYAQSYETQYGLTLMIDTGSEAFANDRIASHYTYTVKTKVRFDSLDKTVSAPAVSLKVKQGKTKFVMDKKSVSLAKLDVNGRTLITIANKDVDKFDVCDIAYVEVASDKKVPVSNAIKLVPVCRGNENVTYAVCWKEKPSSKVTSATVKVNIYLKGNNPDWKKPSITLSLKVNVK